MPKRKKTRHQKVKADMRHKDYKVPAGISVSETKISPPTIINNTSSTVIQQINTSQYSYLYSDLRKTIIVTIIIVGAELVLGYFLFGAHF